MIGIVSAILVPHIKLRLQEQITTSKLKKFYTTINASYQQYVARHGIMKYWGLTEVNGKNAAFVAIPDEVMPKLLNGLKADNVENVLPKQPTNYLGNDDKSIPMPEFQKDYLVQPVYILPDGMTFFWVYVNSLKCKGYGRDICADFFVDINGAKKPNIIGIDQFEFYITSKAILPLGYPNDPKRPLHTDCIVEKAIKGGNGYGCTAWVIEKGTMPWLFGKQPKW